MADEEGTNGAVEASSSTWRKGEEYTRDGTMDFRGRPALRARTGGWRTSWFIYSNNVFFNVGFYGCATNLVLYLTSVMHQSNATASTNVNNWNGVGFITPLIGGFLADAYWGRYWASVVFTFINTIGMILLTVSASVTSLRPQQCSTEDLLCPHASLSQGAFLFFALYVVALGSGAFQVSTSLGADQFDEEDPHEKVQKRSFFNWFFLSINLGALAASTFFVYIQDNVSWGLGFGAAMIAAVAAIVCFLAGTPFYRHNKPGGNPLTRVGQVVVASARKWRLKTTGSKDDLFEVPEGMESVIQGSRKIRHTKQFRFLDKAAVKTGADKSDESSANPWRLCTITQVEEVKALLRMIPIVINCSMFSTVYTQMSTLFIIQGASMDLQMGHFKIPPASLTVMALLSIIVWVLIYDFLLAPFVAKLTKNPRRFTELQRIGIGLFISIFAMIAAAFVEIRRLKVARQHGLLDDPTAVVPLSVFWQVPQFCLVGAAAVFAQIGIYEFFYGESPDSMRGLGTAFAMLTYSLGMFLSSLLLTLVTRITTRNGAPGWIADNLNRGHLDYFFWLLAVMSAVNLVFFVVCAKWYTTMQQWRPDSKPVSRSSPERPSD